MIINLPEKVNQILNVLMAAGYEAYAVGGCVRDSLLSRIPDDWDITTSAKPDQVKKLFNRTIDTGIEHGTVTVMLGKDGFEVTTYRIDGVYEDARHPKDVTFTSLLSEDLRRRDFTINAMAYNDRDGIVDLFGGQEDLKNRIIRAVGNPEERFSEDALRIMRAVRFAGQLGYSIEPSTRKAASLLAPNLSKISAERVRVELVKLMTSNHPELIRDAYEMGITKVVLPEFDRMMETEQNNPHHMYSVGEHTIKSLEYIKKDDFDNPMLTILRMGILLHDCGKPECLTTDETGIDHFYGHPQIGADMAEKILRRLKFDNNSIAAIKAIVKYHDLRPKLTYPDVRKVVNQMGIETFERIYYVKMADIYAKSDYRRSEKINETEELRNIYSEISRNNDPLFIKDLAVNGNDLINGKIAEGRQIGVVLNTLLTKVLERPEINEKERLLEIARKI